MLKIGSLEFNSRERAPRVAAVVDFIVPAQYLLDLKKKGVGLFEVRVDLIAEPLDIIVPYLRELKKNAALPVIGTVRENGRTKKDRAGIYSAIMPYIDCIDIELGAPIAAEVQAQARLAGKAVIVSEHDFEKTPNGKALRAIVDRAVAQGADIVKIATTAKNEEDAWRLLRFAQSCKVPMVAFAMGEAGTFSRIKACEYGSLFTYGYMVKPVAPGQISADELVNIIKPFKTQ
ncbi:MAG: type I 3-dehydroquinate dehydratase [Chitinispirillaceae bacterium]|nr:type I 3-dehydroquinate dehydratase [Chitinispirillaceae bacterium]